jgi:hypothetical protein
MPQVRFEPTIPVFEQAKTVHASVCAATVIGISAVNIPLIYYFLNGQYYESYTNTGTAIALCFRQFPTNL